MTRTILAREMIPNAAKGLPHGLERSPFNRRGCGTLEFHRNEPSNPFLLELYFLALFLATFLRGSFGEPGTNTRIRPSMPRPVRWMP